MHLETDSAGPGTAAPGASGEADRPALGLYLTEPIRGALEFAALPLSAPWLGRAPRGDGHGVLVVPGLLATDVSTRPLRGMLRRLGYDALGWNLGRNLGPTAAVLAGLPRALAELAGRAGGPVSVIGWSLGGIYARELGRDRPDQVRQVITLASPFALTDERHSRAGWSFRRRAHLHAAPGQVPAREQLGRPIPVPSTAVYSRRDGVVAWQACIQPPRPGHENVEVRCAHLGFGVDPATLWLIADRLAQPAGAWQPFRPPPRLRALYPGAR
jgi:hypothetical protein